MMAGVLTVNDVLDGHVVLDIECRDRIYLNEYVPVLQSRSLHSTWARRSRRRR
jgi:hypothetical protein